MFPDLMFFSDFFFVLETEDNTCDSFVLKHMQTHTLQSTRDCIEKKTEKQKKKIIGPVLSLAARQPAQPLEHQIRTRVYWTSAELLKHQLLLRLQRSKHQIQAIVKKEMLGGRTQGLESCCCCNS